MLRMNVTFKVRFHTTFGQSLWITGNHPLLGNGDAAMALPLAYLNDEFWSATVFFPDDGLRPDHDLVYHYLLRQPDGTSITDWGNDHRLTATQRRQDELVMVDSWNAASTPENAFFTEPFRKVLLRERQTAFTAPAPARSTHTFRVKAPLLTRGQTLCLLGSAAELGHWDTSHPTLLNRQPGEDHLSVEVDLTNATFPIEYKYGVFDGERNTFVTYEGGFNRRLEEPSAPGRHVVLSDGFAALPFDTWKGAGVAIPVFSLRSENSFGVGEFTDLKRLADWCRLTGLKLIQILPVNDTTSTHAWTDSYPYSAVSAFALHPIYLNLAAVASRRNQALLVELESERRRLNALPELDYPSVMRIKLEFLRRIFPTQKAATFRSKAYRAFWAENERWLTPYAVFCCLRDRFGTADYQQWPEHRRCTPAVIQALTDSGSPEAETVALHYFIQFHLHQQLQEAAAYAHNHGVVLKGDIAIGVSRGGADTWQEPELYDLSVQAGAPPDPFAEKGQNWGFPTYNWSRMREDDFAWWKRRFAQMARYFDTFRMDHILGFFRIWSIPAHAVEGLLGRFVPALPVRLEEFAARGISFDRTRFLEPFITDAIVAELFDSEAGAVKADYLQPTANGHYAMRPEFATQRQVEHHFDALEPTAKNRKLKAGLFDLISNVLLLEAEGATGPELHFRFHIEKTTSFRHLNHDVQARLLDLYVDYFFRRQDDFWRQQALQKLPALKRVTNMLICGEDLGLVPGCVPGVMRELGLLSLEIQRMPKTPGRAFSRPSEAPYLSVVTPSTHDMSTLRGWWEEDPKLTQRFYHEELGRPGRAPDRCDGALNELMVRQHLASPAMWSIFQLQDWLGMDESLRHPDPHAERINIPAKPRHFWRYRMHLTLESLLRAREFNQRVQQHGR